MSTGDAPSIRDTVATDGPALRALYEAAFPDEDLQPLVRRLLAEVPDILSLVAVIGAEPAGHILFTPCAVQGTARRVALLGPCAVAPLRQGQGLGSALIRSGFIRLALTDLRQVLVLGDPGFYRRFGFRRETSIQPPYSLPAAWADAWQSVMLADGGEARAGVLLPPAAWLSRSLWAP